ncbi:hypothetical protein FA13DRAFT_1720106 [Coprinellus micaceus]|uniref:Uncharacterized protein n=1 Tax=Coprinellus micaceus TaxID=71717 RepID=A0A4Y7S9W4_COPMI|nr:hypothetical protein FA13DRAFT_1720106 [Coprinellus micaceus]
MLEEGVTIFVKSGHTLPEYHMVRTSALKDEGSRPNLAPSSWSWWLVRGAGSHPGNIGGPSRSPLWDGGVDEWLTPPTCFDSELNISWRAWRRAGQMTSMLRDSGDRFESVRCIGYQISNLLKGLGYEEADFVFNLTAGRWEMFVLYGVERLLPLETMGEWGWEEATVAFLSLQTRPLLFKPNIDNEPEDKGEQLGPGFVVAGLGLPFGPSNISPAVSKSQERRPLFRSQRIHPSQDEIWTDSEGLECETYEMEMLLYLSWVEALDG